MAKGVRPEGMKEDETLIQRSVTQIYRDKNIADATYNAAVAKFGEKASQTPSASPVITASRR